MRKCINWLKIETIRLLPVFLFFFVIFYMIHITRLVNRVPHQDSYSFVMIVLSALVMAKVIFITDFIPLINRQEKKPLIYITLWKTLLYSVVTVIVRILDHAVEVLSEGQGSAFEELVQPQFWVIQMWLFALLLIFVAYNELIRAVGSAKAKELFFGKKKS